MAQFKIDELHKMAKTPYYKSFPIVCCCLRLCAKDEDEKKEDVEEIRKEHYKNIEDAKGKGKKERKGARKLLKLFEAKCVADKEMEDDLDNVGGDAFMLLGSGLMAYRKMLMSLTICFILMSLFMAPIIVSYGLGSGLDNANNVSAMDRFTLANMGYSNIQCS